MQFIDLSFQQKRIKSKIEENIRKVLDHGKYIMGPEVSELEKKLADFVGVRHAIACASGTDALLMALMAYDVKPGDGILTSPFTFIATAEVISLLGAVPIFVDIDPGTFNIKPEFLIKAIEALKQSDDDIYPLPKNINRQGITPKGIISVDLFGLPADYKKINSIAKEHNLFVIEDAAQSFGAEYHGRKAGALADIACTSFFPAKPLGCYGDGGMCFTDGDDVSEIIDSLRVHGKGHHKYDNVRIGINGRLDTIQAAILLAKMSIFPEEIELRQTVVRRYSDLLAGQSSIIAPKISEGMTCAWAQYSLLAQDEAHRAKVQDRLKSIGVPTAIYYPKPLHLQPAFEFLEYDSGSFPTSENFSKRVFSIPMHPYLTMDDQRKIVDGLL
jgi:UDP-2-acetamido-2-deoxy-ribo-hexuluronate aminotransferase